MAWTIEFEEQARRDLAKLDKSVQREIIRYLESRIANAENPKSFGHALTHDLSDLWRYRVRDYRIICQLIQDRLVVLVVAIGHRSNVYNKTSSPDQEQQLAIAVAPPSPLPMTSLEA